MRKNGAGYRDDTAFRAISNVIREERKAKKRENRDRDRNSPDGSDYHGRKRSTDGGGNAAELERDNG